ncbi:hypothetical protein GW932_00480 [archaeon]|nr:hypothetical protein [archaeon]
MTKHICTICKNSFPDKDSAIFHEELPILEGIYHGMILKEEIGYLVFRKSDKISKEHERIYTVSKFFKVQDKGGIGRYLKKYSYSEIDKKVEDKEFVGLSTEEFESVKHFLEKNHLYHDILEFKNLDETLELIPKKKRNN